MKEKWETILSDESETTDRIRVPSGFLYRVRTFGGEDCRCDAMSVVFVPDAKDGKDD